MNIFSENMGTPSSNTGIVAYASGTAPATFQNKGVLTYGIGGQTTSDVRTSSASTTYSGASGGGNVFFTGTGSIGFSIESINTSAHNTLTLQFGYRKESATLHATFAVEYSTNGTTWNNIANTSGTLFNEAATSTTGWYLSRTLTLPAAAQVSNLRIRFVKTGSASIRIDDVVLKGTLGASAPTITSSTSTQSTTVLSPYAGYTITGSNSPTSYSATGLPSGLSVNTTSGAISGTPATGTVGVYTVTASAENATGTGTATFLLNVNKANQTISFTPTLTNKVVGDPAVNLTATSASGLAVSYATSDAGVAALSSNVLSFPGAGTATITASQAGDADYNAATDVTQTQIVTGAPLQNQTITFSLTSAAVYGDVPLALTATSTSGLTVSYASSNPAIASIVSGALQINSVGTVTITASQAGDAAYNPATDVTQVVTISQKGLTIVGATAANKTYDGTTTASVTGASLSGVVGSDNVALSAANATFASANAGTGIAVSTNYSLINSTAPNYSITAQPSGLTADINKATPSITFAPLSSIGVGNTAPLNTTTVPSGLTITYSSNTTAVATIAAIVVTGVALGTTTITADFAGDANYNAVSATQPLTVAAVPVMYNFGTSTVQTSTPTSGTPVANLSFGNISGAQNGGTSVYATLGNSNSTGYTGATGAGNATIGTRGSGFDKDTSTYFTVTITPDVNYQVNLNSLSFGSRQTSTGPQFIVIRTSVDNFASNTLAPIAVLANSVWALNTFSFSSPIISLPNSPLVVRVYGYGGTSSATTSANFRIDDLSISANATAAACTAPTVTVTGTNTICNGASTTLTAAGADTYLWSSPLTATTNTVSVSPTSTTIYTVTGSVAGGCTATSTIEVIVNQLSAPSSVALTPACGVTNVTLPNGSTTSNISEAVTYANAAGCDSVVTYNITYKAASAPSSVALTPACGVTNVTLPNGSTTSNTSQAVTYLNAAGCDSVVTYNITYKAASAPSSVALTPACGVTSVTLPNGATTSNASEVVTYANAAGCDSVVTYNITYKAASAPSSVALTPACGVTSVTLPNGSTTSNTSEAVTYVNAAGCDSVVTYNITYKAASAPSSVSLTPACGVTNVTLPNGSITSNTSQAVTYVNAAGCDSVVTYNITYKAASAPSSVALTPACGVTSVTLPNGSTTSNTSQAVTYVNASGCDSVVTYNITYKAASAPSSIALTPACGVTNVTLPNGSTTSNTSQAVTYVNASGCDSVVTYNVTYKAASAPSSIALTPACGVTSVTLPNGSTTSNTSQAVTYLNAAGCDSVVTYNITYKAASAPSSVALTPACGVTNVTLPNGSTTSSTSQAVTYVNAAGCDSVVTYNVTYKAASAPSSVALTPACGVTSVTLPNGSTTSNTSQAVTYVNASGCDSVVTYNITYKAATTIAINITIPSASLPYVWNTQTLTSAGSATFTTNGSNGCDSTTVLTLFVNAPSIINFTTAVSDTFGSPITALACNGDLANLLIDNVSGGTAPYSFSIDNGSNYQTNNLFTNLLAGNYSVVVKDVNNTTSATIITINQPAPLVINSVVTNIPCFGGQNGSIAATVTGGIQFNLPSPSYFVLIDGQTPNAFDIVDNLSAGLYTIEAVDANFCFISKTVTITAPSVPISATIAETAETCSGLFNGTATVTASNGTAPYSYAWSNGQTTAIATGLGGATYTVIVTDNNNCSDSNTVTFIPIGILGVSSTYTNVLCKGQSTGAVFAAATGGTTPYTYTWSNAVVGQNNTNIPAGTYTVEVKDANNCTTLSTATIAEPATNVSIATNVITNVLCKGSSTGALTFTTSGGTGAIVVTPSASNLAAGTYTFTATDANGCTATVSATIAEPATNVSIATNVITNVLCKGSSTGAVTFTTSGGTGAIVVTPSASNLAAGTYTFTATDANGCTATISATIAEPATNVSIATNVITNELCKGSSIGAVTFTTSGGTGAIVVTPSATNLAAGTYTFTATDANGCTATITATIAEPATNVSIATNVITNVLCKGSSTGAVTFTTSGGTGAIVVTPSASNLAAGTYTFTATDANLCTATVSATIAEPATNVSIATNVITNVLCKGSSTGSVTFTTVGGTGAIVVTPSATNLAAGTYTFTATDANGCTATVSATIAEPATTVSIATNVITNVLCKGSSTGAVTFTTSGGTGAIVVTPSASNLAAGTYTFTATDANACTATVSATIAEPATNVSIATNVITNVLCKGSSTGAVTFTTSGGTGAIVVTPSATNLSAGTYNFTATDANLCTATVTATIAEPATNVSIATDVITNVLCKGSSTGAVTFTTSGGTDAIVVTPSASNLSAGTYTFTATDANGCTATITATIAEPATTVSIATDVITNVLCKGSSTGAVTFTTSGGTGAIVVTPSATNLAAGTYTFTATDANGCTATITATIAEPATNVSIATDVITNVLCKGSSTGAVTFTTSGGTGAIVVTPSATNLAAGTYTFTATDANGCTATITATIAEPATTVSIATDVITNVLCKGSSTGAVTFTTSGGTGAIVVTPSATNLAAGTYTFTATDANLCTATVSATIAEPATTVSIATDVITNVLCKGSSTGAVTFTTSGGTGAIVVTPSAMNLAAGTYTFTATDANLCTATVSATIAEPATTVSIATDVITNVLCKGSSTGAVTFTTSGGTGAIVVTPSATNLAAGTYTFTATDANLCTATVTATIAEPATNVSIATDVITNVLCKGSSTGAVTFTTSGGTGAIVVTPSATNLAAGTYTFTATDANLCTATVTATIAEPATNVSIATDVITNVLCKGSSTGAVTFTTSGGTGAIVVTPSATNLAAGTYTFTATDANGCTATVSATIAEPADNVSIATDVITNVLCKGLSTGAVTFATAGGTGAIVVTPSASNLAAGTYTFTATDANLCTATVTATIAEPATNVSIATDVITNVLCKGSSTGAVTFTTSGGTGAIVVTPSAMNLAAGTYTFTATDANGCTATVSATIAEPATTVSIATDVITNVLCKGSSTGAVTFTTSGGTGAIVVTPSATNLAAGTYTFTATDANLCTATVTATIAEPATNVSIATDVITNVLCKGSSTGAVTFTTSGGTGAIVVTPSATNLAAGTYTFTATDANGCTATVSATIAEPADNVSIATDVITNVLCKGLSTGAVTFATAGGTGAIVVTPSASNLAAGTYTFTATDANLCTATVTATIAEPATNVSIATDVITNVLCKGSSTGAVTFTTSGGTGAIVVTPSAMNLAAGTYTFTATDANGCTATVSATIAEPATTVSIATDVITNVLCKGSLTGAVNFTIAGGTGAIVVTPSATNLAAGTYTFTATDANGCTATISATIAEPATNVSIATDVITNVLCKGSSTGAVTFTTSGGTGAIVVTPSAMNLAAGTYTFTATDANLCTATVTATIAEPATTVSIVTDVITNVLCKGSSTGAVTFTTSGGTGAIVVTPSASNLAAGTYTFTATDANLCTATVSATIAEPADNLAINAATIVQPACFNTSNGSISITAVGGTGSKSFTISPFLLQISNGNFINAAANTYTITATDINGCITATAVVLTNPAPITFAPLIIQSPLCHSAKNGTLTAIASGGTGAFTYTLLPSTPGILQPVAGTFINLGSSIYQVRATDAKGCSRSTVAALPQPQVIKFTNVSTAGVKCFGGNDGSLTATTIGGTGTRTLSLNPIGTVINATTIGSLSATSYSLTVTDGNSCKLTTVVVITQPGAISWYPDVILNPTVGSNGSIVVAATGGTGTKLYTLAPSYMTPTLSGTFMSLAAGTYTATATDINGCTVSRTIQLGAASIVINDGTIKTESTEINSNVVRDIIIYPNPTNGLSNIKFSSSTEGAATVLVMDVQGKIMRRVEVSINKGDNAIELDLSNLNNGNYTISIINSWMKITEVLQKK